MNALRGLAGRLRRRMSARLGGGRYVLMYHRVERLEQDPWGLAVTPERFAEQLRVLADYGACLMVGEMMRLHAAGRLPRRAVAVTFDDGYADNALAAMPLLRKAGVPATLFLSTGLLDGRTPFWWDALAGLILMPGTLPGELELRTTGLRMALGPAAGLSRPDWDRHRGWRAWDPPPTPRHGLYLDLWHHLRPLPPCQIAEAVAELAGWAGRRDLPADLSRDRPMTRTEAAQVAASPLIEIGGHTVAHPTLPAHPAPVQRREIADGRAACEAIAGRRVTSFAFPYGDHGDGTVAAVREAGFTVACTTRPGRLDATTDPMRVPRVTMGDWSGAELSRRLSNGWLV